MKSKTVSKTTIIKFHYCRSCGILGESGEHSPPHFRSNERHGFLVLYYPPKNMLFITPTFSSTGSINTYFDLQHRSFNSELGWLWYGSPEEFYRIASEYRDMDITIRQIVPADYNYKEIAELYKRYVHWYMHSYTAPHGSWVKQYKCIGRACTYLPYLCVLFNGIIKCRLKCQNEYLRLCRTWKHFMLILFVGQRADVCPALQSPRWKTFQEQCFAESSVTFAVKLESIILPCARSV